MMTNLRVEKYRKGRYWALYQGHALVVVTVYQRGAFEVARRLAATESPESVGDRHDLREEATQ